ncbi:hypothetical protein PMAYCL1PPCAC_20782, partial [Pristionchus mayeri]
VSAIASRAREGASTVLSYVLSTVVSVSTVSIGVVRGTTRIAVVLQSVVSTDPVRVPRSLVRVPMVHLVDERIGSPLLLLFLLQKLQESIVRLRLEDVDAQATHLALSVADEQMAVGLDGDARHVRHQSQVARSLHSCDKLEIVVENLQSPSFGVHNHDPARLVHADARCERALQSRDLLRAFFVRLRRVVKRLHLDRAHKSDGGEASDRLLDLPHGDHLLSWVTHHQTILHYIHEAGARRH